MKKLSMQQIWELFNTGGWWEKHLSFSQCRKPRTTPQPTHGLNCWIRPQPLLPKCILHPACPACCERPDSYACLSWFCEAGTGISPSLILQDSRAALVPHLCHSSPSPGILGNVCSWWPREKVLEQWKSVHGHPRKTLHLVGVQNMVCI